MRLSLALLALLAPGVAANALECGLDAFSPEALRVPCGKATPEGVAQCGRYQDAAVGACHRDLADAQKVISALGKRSRTPDEEKTYKDASLKFDNAWATLLDATGMRAVSANDETSSDYRLYNELAPGFIALQATKPLSKVEIFPPKNTSGPAGDDGKGAPATPGKAVVSLVEKAQIVPQKPDPAKVKTISDKYLAAGSPDDAARLAQGLIDKAPGDARGPAVMAQASLAKNDPGAAADWARKALALDPKNKDARQALAFAEASLAKSGLKGPVRQPGFELKPDAGNAGAGLAAGGRPAAAGTAPGQPGAVSDAALPVPPHLKLALRKAAMGDYAGALSDLTLALDQNPDDLAARLARAEVSNAMRNPVAGLADAERVLQKNPDDPRALRAKADALLQLGRLEEALVTIERAVSLEPASASGHLLKAHILEKLGRNSAAGEEFKEAARLDPALTPVAEEALRRLGLAPATDAQSVSPAVQRRLLRGGLIVFSLLLVLAGLVGGARMATRRARGAAIASDSGERTVREGDTVAGQYTITRELGRGGMGVVFEAVDETLKRPVALKQMQAEFRASPEEAARFLQEARLVAQLKHPNIAEIYTAVDDGGLFLVFELVNGETLDRRFTRNGVGADEARSIVAGLCSALSAAHARRIIHRDLKPSNVMIAADGTAKIMDFGIAHQARGTAAATQTAASGTPPYMAPEQAMGSVLPASDLYALAVMSYELLCGTRPFLGPDFLGPKMRAEFPPVTRMNPSLPAGLDAFFSSALSPDAERRPADAAAFARQFEACWNARPVA